MVEVYWAEEDIGQEGRLIQESHRLFVRGKNSIPLIVERHIWSRRSKDTHSLLIKFTSLLWKITESAVINPPVSLHNCSAVTIKKNYSHGARDRGQQL